MALKMPGSAHIRTDAGPGVDVRDTASRWALECRGSDRSRMSWRKNEESGSWVDVRKYVRSKSEAGADSVFQLSAAPKILGSLIDQTRSATRLE